MIKGALMVQGTTSDAGKSTLVAALCRVFARRGYNVAPFKPQNMALNSAVTEDGGEIGRAQALQAQACFLKTHTDMNPVLIKPNSDIGAQIIVQGQVLGNMNADTYHQYKPTAKAAVFESFERLKNQYEVVVIEGAGSPAEINLRKGDIANMGFAEEADCPVIIVADIDKGGVFAHLIGTLELLSKSERDRVVGFVINKFRGDIALLQSGLDWLENRTQKPVLGVLPYLHDFLIDAEDAIDSRQAEQNNTTDLLKVVVPVFPRISNHTDFDALRAHPSVHLELISLQQTPPPCDLIILPGSKNVRDDLNALIKSEWQEHINKHLRYGGKILGICGGYQMLGQKVADPLGIEGEPGEATGLALLPLSTVLQKNKTLEKKHGILTLNNSSVSIEGYEIHHGQSQSELDAIIHFSDGTKDGCVSPDGLVLGSYLHGIFDNKNACQAILKWAGLTDAPVFDLNEQREQQINRLADSTEKHLDIQTIINIMQLPSSPSHAP